MGLEETDSRDVPQWGNHISNEEMELPEQIEKTESTVGGLDNSFYSSASGSSQQDTSRNSKTGFFSDRPREIVIQQTYRGFAGRTNHVGGGGGSQRRGGK